MEEQKPLSLDEFYDSDRGDHFFPITDSKLEILLHDRTWHPGAVAVHVEHDDTLETSNS